MEPAVTGAPAPTLETVARSRRRELLPATLYGVARQISYLSVPLFLERTLDAGLVDGDMRAAAGWSAAIVAASLTETLLLAGWTRWTNLADVRTGVDLRLRLARHLGTLDRAATDGLGQGDVVLRATRDVETVGAWVHGRPHLWVIAATFGFVLPALAGLDPVLLLVALAMVPVVVAVSGYHRPRLARDHEGLSSAHGGRADAVEDLLSASTAVRGLGGETELVRRHHERSGLLARRTLRAARRSADWQAQGAAVPRIAVAAGLLLGGGAVIDGSMTVGGLVAFTSWMVSLEMATRVLVDRLADRASAGVALDRIAAVLAARPSIAQGPAARRLPPRGALTARDVLWHPGRPPVDLDVEAGRIVVVTGPSGSGKSSLLRLLARHDDPVAGRVTFGGVDLREAQADDVARRLVLVPQRPQLLAGTLRDCLLGGGAVPLDDAALLSAAHVAALDAFLAHLPRGLDTVVGERGTTLSGGQRQRLALARAVARDPAVLLADDVTSALDHETEHRLISRLKAWAGSRRAVVLASHRTGVLAVADLVVMMPAPALRTAAALRTASGGACA